MTALYVACAIAAWIAVVWLAIDIWRDRTPSEPAESAGSAESGPPPGRPGVEPGAHGPEPTETLREAPSASPRWEPREFLEHYQLTATPALDICANYIERNELHLEVYEWRIQRFQRAVDHIIAYTDRTYPPSLQEAS